MVEVGEFLLRVLEQLGSAVLLLFIVLFGIWKFKDDIKECLQSIIASRQNAKEGQKARLLADVRLKQTLNILREELEADKAGVFEFHNGGHNATGLPFRHLSMSLLLNYGGYTEDVRDFGNIPTSSIVDFTTKIKENNFVYFEDINDLKNIFPSLYYRLKNDGIVEALFAPINGVEEDHIGIAMLAITTKHSEEFDRPRIESILIPRLLQLSTLLDLKNHK